MGLTEKLEEEEEEMNRRKEDDSEEAAAKESLSIEQIFASKEVPPWQKQVTIRALVVSFVLSILFTFIVMKLNLTTGIIPSLNVSAGLLGFFFIKTWTKLVQKSGMLKQPFTRQENTVIQTCVVASSGIAFSGMGFSLYNIYNCFSLILMFDLKYIYVCVCGFSFHVVKKFLKPILIHKVKSLYAQTNIFSFEYSIIYQNSSYRKQIIENH